MRTEFRIGAASCGTIRTEICIRVPFRACTNIVATARVLDGETCAPNEDTEMVSWLVGNR